MYILASDYDGTLTHDGIVSEEDRLAIEKWQMAGNLFGINSGRGYSSICKEMIRNNLVCDFHICNNGSIIYDGDSEPVDQTAAGGKILQSLIPFIIESGGFDVSIYRVHESYRVIIGNEERRNFHENWITANDLKIIPYFNQVDTRFIRDNQAGELTGQVNRQFGKYVTALQNGVNVNIVPAGVDKATGLLHYMALKNVPKNHVLAIGDDYNDLNMILEFNGYTVTSGRPEVIAHAKKAYNSIAGLIKEYLPG
ncbi:MAG: HAD-IIB family hydrolase [Clostridiales bacterium]|nr:HAD-IIB family hydrolase [Clostridiales bacterium]HBM80397.1 hypothetical protein [Clostridiaceae bacterium]